MKHVFVLIAASLVNYWLGWWFGEKSLTGFLVLMYSDTVATTLWYLWAHLGLILALPFLRKIAKSMRFIDCIYLIGIKLLFSGLIVFDFLTTNFRVGYNSSFTSFVTTNIFIYPLLGYYFANELKEEDLTGKRVLLAIGLAFAAIVAEGWLTCVWCEYMGEWNGSICQKFFDVFVYLPACAFFLAMKYLFSRIHIGNWTKKLIVHMGSCTFGIFLFETLFREYNWRVYMYMVNFVPPYVACLIWVFSAFATGIVVTTVLKMIPGVRRFI